VGPQRSTVIPKALSTNKHNSSILLLAHTNTIIIYKKILTSLVLQAM
jgi:hypothetical protein